MIDDNTSEEKDYKKVSDKKLGKKPLPKTVGWFLK